MIKINLNTPMLNIRGKQVEIDDVDEKGKPIKVKATIRDYLLMILGSRFPLQNNKEAFWTTVLGDQIASKTKIIEEKNEKTGKTIKKEVPNIEIEISDDKAKFLKRIIENNKIIQQGPMGQKNEIEVFFPYELGQLLKIFENLKE